MYVNAKILYGWAMSENLPYDEINFDRNVRLEEISNTPDDSDIGYFIEVDLKNPDKIKYQTKNFPFAPKNKKIILDEFLYLMKEIKPDRYLYTN